jgi:hypothetical protein
LRLTGRADGYGACWQSAFGAEQMRISVSAAVAGNEQLTPVPDPVTLTSEM